MTTAYDRVLYPTTLFEQTHPDRMFALARLGGLDPVDPRQARIMDIGGGNCVNLMALAAAWPGCEAHGFDLSANAVATGERIRAASGLANVHLAVEDLTVADRRYPAGSFDYIICHGVYAWVPPFVRDACMKLVSHLLSDRGVAVISYNAMPGGHIRMLMREMLQIEVGHLEDPEEKMAAARDFLEKYMREDAGSDPMRKVLGIVAESMLARPETSLFHDEMGECFYPQRVDEVASAAAGVGLRYLTDSGTHLQLGGFLPGPDLPDDPDAEVVGQTLRHDYATMRFFRHSLFVRDSQPLDRRIEAGRMDGLYLSSNVEREEDGGFRHKEHRFEIRDEVLAAAVDQVAVRFPFRVPVEEVTDDPRHRRVLLELANQNLLAFHSGPAPFADRAGPRPEVSPLVRGMLACGERKVATLSHDLVAIDQASARALLSAADGTRTIEDIRALDTGIPPAEVEDALADAAKRGLVRA